MAKASVFKNNRNQAIRLPKSVAFSDDVKQVDIVVIGETRIMTPSGHSWGSWFDGENVSLDFMESRDQPSDQEREVL